MAKYVTFTLSRHAKRRLAARQVAAPNVSHPDWTESDEEDDTITHAIKRIFRRGGSDVLRVLYNHDVRPFRIVTAYFDRRRGRSRR